MSAPLNHSREYMQLVADQAAKTKELQKQFICPIWTVWFGKSVKVYFTNYHAEQMARALRLNQTPYAYFDGRGNSMAEG